MGSKCCKTTKSPEEQNRLLRREIAGSGGGGGGQHRDSDTYRASNNNLYPLRISEIRPVGDRGAGLYTFIPPTTPPRARHHSKEGSSAALDLSSGSEKMTLITSDASAKVPVAMSKEDEGGNVAGGPPIFLRLLQDAAVKVGTKARLLVEVDPNFGGGLNNNGILKVTWYRNDVRILNKTGTLSSSSSGGGAAGGGGDAQTRFVQGSDGRFHFVDITTVHTEDEGKWICLVENFNGRSSSTCQLKVLVPKAYKAPEFVDGLKALLTEAGTVSLECKVLGVPTCTLRWFKDGVEIRAGDIFALRGDPSSLGVYTCEATNCMGSVTSSSKVHMGGLEAGQDRLSIVQNLADTRIRVGNGHEFLFKTSRPLGVKDVVEWSNKSKRIEFRGDRVIPSVDGTVVKLTLSQVEVQDDGEWTCEITSSGHKITTTCSMAILIPRNYRKPRFLENLKAILTEEGLVSFECKVCGFPTPSLSWYKDENELKPGDVYQLSGANSLGVYKCVAHNCMGSAESSTELTLDDIQHQLSDEEKKQLLADKAGAARPPKFLKGLKSLEVKITEPCQLEVQVNDPKATVLWFRDGAPVYADNEKYFIKGDKGSHTLDIKSLELEDQAEWKCTASNDYGHSFTSSRVKLTIPSHFKKPKFLESLRAILSEEGTVNLECKVIGVPVPKLTWIKDGVELKAGDIHRIISGSDGTCCLGTYCCQARNCMGTTSSSAALLGFEDKLMPQKQAQMNEAQQKNLSSQLTRDPSLSTILEERTSQIVSQCETPMALNNRSIEEDVKGEISLSIDGKEVSVSLYETPDLTENDAKQIIEMFAEEYSEYISEHNIVPLPSLRFMKETSTSGNIVMEAVVIDVTDDPFESAKSASVPQVKEDLTEGDVEDISESFESPLEMSEEGLERRHSGLSRSRRSSSKRSNKSAKRTSQASLAGSEEGFVTADSEGTTFSQKFAEAQETLASLHEAETLYTSAKDSKRAEERVSSSIEAKKAKAEHRVAQKEVTIMDEESLQTFSPQQPQIRPEVGMEPKLGLLCHEDRHLTEMEMMQDLSHRSETLCDMTYEPFQALEHDNEQQLFDTIGGLPSPSQSLQYQYGQGLVDQMFQPVQELQQQYSYLDTFEQDPNTLYQGHEELQQETEKFIGIEMAEMLLEGADTISDFDSMSTTGVQEKDVSLASLQQLRSALQPEVRQGLQQQFAGEIQEENNQGEAPPTKPARKAKPTQEKAKAIQAEEDKKVSPEEAAKLKQLEQPQMATPSTPEEQKQEEKKQQMKEQSVATETKLDVEQEGNQNNEDVTTKLQDMKKAEQKKKEKAETRRGSNAKQNPDDTPTNEIDATPQQDLNNTEASIKQKEEESTRQEMKQAEVKRQEAEKNKKEVETKKPEENKADEAKKLNADENNETKATKLEEEKKAAEATKLEQEKNKDVEAKKLEEEKKAAEDRKVEEEKKKKDAEAKKLEEEKKATEAKKVEEEKKKKEAEAKKLEEEKNVIEAKKVEEEKKKKEAEAKKLEEEKKAIEAKKVEEEKKKKEVEAKKLEEENKAIEANKVEEEKKKKEAETKKLEEEKKAIEAKKVEEEKKKKDAEAKKLEEEKKAAEAKKVEEEKKKKEVEAKKLEEEKKAIEAKKVEEEKKKKDAEAKKLEAEKKAAEAKKVEEENKKKEAEAKTLEEEKKAAEAKKVEEEKKKKEAEAKKLEEEKKAIEAKKVEEEKKKKEVEAKKLEEEKKATEAKVEEEKKEAEAKKLEEVKKAAEAKKVEEQKQKEAEAKKLQEEKKKEAEAKKLEEEKKAAEAKKLEEEKKAAEAKVEEEKKKKEAEAKKLEEEKKAAEAKKVEDQKKKEAEEKKAAEAKKVEEQKKKEAEAKKLEESNKAAEAKKVEEERKKEAEAKKLEEQKKVAEKKKVEEEKKKAAEAKKLEEEKKAADAKKLDDQTKKDLEAKKQEEEKVAAAKKIEDEKVNKLEEKRNKEAEEKKLEEDKAAEAKKQEAERKATEAKKIEEESKKKEDERMKIEEEKKRKEAEAKKLEEEKKTEARRADEEKMHMDAAAKKAEEEKKRKEAEAKKAEEETKKEEADAKKAEEEKKKKEADAKKAEEEKKKKEADEKKSEEEKKKEADSKKAEEDKKMKETEVKKAEEEKKKNVEAKKVEDEKKRKEAEAKKVEEVKKEAESKKAEEDKKKKETEAKKGEEETKSKEADAKKVEEEKKKVTDAKKAEDEKKKVTDAEKAEKGSNKKETDVKKVDEAMAKDTDAQKAEPEKKKVAELKIAEEENKKKETDAKKGEEEKKAIEAKAKAEKGKNDAETKAKQDENRKKDAEAKKDATGKPKERKGSDASVMNQAEAVKRMDSVDETTPESPLDDGKRGKVLEKRPSLDEPLKLSGVKKVNKIELQSLKVPEATPVEEETVLSVSMAKEEPSTPPPKETSVSKPEAEAAQSRKGSVTVVSETEDTKRGSQKKPAAAATTTKTKRKESLKDESTKETTAATDDAGKAKSSSVKEKEAKVKAAEEKASVKTESLDASSPSKTEEASKVKSKSSAETKRKKSLTPQSPTKAEEVSPSATSVKVATESTKPEVKESKAKAAVDAPSSEKPKSGSSSTYVEDSGSYLKLASSTTTAKEDDVTVVQKEKAEAQDYHRESRTTSRVPADELRPSHRSRSYDQLLGSSTSYGGDHYRGVVTVGAESMDRASPHMIMAQDRMESMGYFSSGSHKNLYEDSNKSASSSHHPLPPPMHHSRYHRYHPRDEDSLAELDELPNDHHPPPPTAPPRYKKQRRTTYQTKLSSEAEDLLGRGFTGSGYTYTGYASSARNIPSYFTLPSIGYSYFSLSSLPGTGGSSAGSLEHMDELSRRRKPRFSMKLQDRTTPVNTETVKFTCTVFGQPPPTIQWYKNSIPIFSDRQKYTITNCHGVAVLDIKNINKNDEGIITCYAQNFYGKAASSAVFQVVGMGDSTKSLGGFSGDASCSGDGSRWMPGNFTTEIMDTYFPEVNELVLECQVTANPKPDIMWMKNGEIIIEYGTSSYGRFRAEYLPLFETGKCRLIIQRPRESDSGVYTCCVRNFAAGISGRNICMNDEVTKLVNVKQNSAPGGVYAYVPPKGTVGMKTSNFEYQSPTFLTPLEDYKKIHLGEDLILTVEIIGTPTPTVRWFHHKSSALPLQSSGRVRIVNEAPGVHTLLISGITAYDLGSYIVQVHNKYGQCESSCSVSELIPGVSDRDKLTNCFIIQQELSPAFVKEPPEMFCLRCGDDWVVECQVEGWPQPSVNLYRGCRNVTLQPRAYKELLPQVSLREDQQHVRFTLSRLQCTDFGLYTIEAKNIAGAVKCFVNLKLRDRAHSMTPSPASCPARQLWTGSLTRLDHRSSRPYYPSSAAGRSRSSSRLSSSRRSFSTFSLPYSSLDY